MVTCSLGTLASGAAATVTITTQADGEGNGDEHGDRDSLLARRSQQREQHRDGDDDRHPVVHTGRGAQIVVARPCFRRGRAAEFARCELRMALLGRFRQEESHTLILTP